MPTPDEASGVNTSAEAAIQSQGETSKKNTAPLSSLAVSVNLAGIKPPSNLNVKENLTENWKSYKQRWESYAIVANLATPILEKFDECTIGEVNETYERYVFNNRNQGESESIGAYEIT